MPRVVIDNREVDVPQGSTLLDAARALGLDVPALCWREGCRPNTSCMVCLMKIAGGDKFVPSCATIAEDGMCVESETAEVRQARRTSLELLLSDHAGECRAPCQYACAFDTDVPRMIRHIAAGRVAEAAAIVREAMPLAAVLTRASPEVCEGACRRCAVDEAAAIGLLKQYVADHDLASPEPYEPPREPDSGKCVAIVGAGPAGLSAAYFLLLGGHACAVFDAKPAAGGILLDLDEKQLPHDVLTREIARIEGLGARFELATSIGSEPPLDALRRDYDAVLIAVGKLESDSAEYLGLPASGGRLVVKQSTHETEAPGVFAAGDVVRPRSHAVRAAANGKAAAACIDQYLRGDRVTKPAKLPNLKLGHPDAGEVAIMAAEAGQTPRVVPSAVSHGLSDEEAQAEARRCLRCDCEHLGTCTLGKYAEEYGANAGRYRGQRRRREERQYHPDIVYEPGKCILCGLCVQIAEQHGEELGLTFVGRGFDVRVAVPFDEPLAKALKRAARQCAEACPSGALALR
ncbi:MAG: 2Fe-2S iron-sulfur cluster-binding protein, partial [Planctomycetota bacterium]